MATTDQTSDLFAFHEFVGQQLAAGAKLSPEAALDLWREMNPIDNEDDLLAAAKEALDAMARGDRGVPADEFFRRFRAEHGLD